MEELLQYSGVSPVYNHVIAAVITHFSLLCFVYSGWLHRLVGGLLEIQSAFGRTGAD